MDFPLHGLDLQPYLLTQPPVPPLYDCFAVSNHYGSLGGGHYTAYAKLPYPLATSPTAAGGTGGGDDAAERCGSAAALGASAHLGGRWGGVRASQCALPFRSGPCGCLPYE